MTVEADALSPLVNVTRTPVKSGPTGCEWCEHRGNVGVYWTPSDNQSGCLQVCGCCHVVDAVETALGDAPADAVITVEVEIYTRGGGTSGVHRFLVTAPDDLKMNTWAATRMFSNWVEGRENGSRETWLVTVYAAHAESFLETARNIGVTVEEIKGGGESQSYVLRVGEPGSGWQGRTS
jgi:hypothetical protein